ncbi:sensor domain-containing diguanylate cyclase [Paenibacillus endoradicis]|uniref:sensor domain-containing diguanylate cyclase n=1 Tax=Paenibacillus endoradicis TaxID=2972487 RepID=UPI002158CBE9|nr:sensor domain-containing diguanylate cyclase [Paenibacillus endoradicis]MCR8658772.1 sensor domain-containing diguanylate cyclase [Paenibacillus endoradicis]
MDDRLLYAPCGYLSITHEGKIISVNNTFLMQMGYNEHKLLNQHIEELMSTANKLIFHSYFYPFINLHGYVNELIISLKNSEGIAIACLINGKQLLVDDVEVFDLIIVQMGQRMNYEQELRTAKKQIEDAYWKKDQALEELTKLNIEIEQKQEELIMINESLIELSVTDKLTGLKNRRYFQEKLEDQIINFARKEKPFSLCIIDIDHFKHVNDTYGHQVGDEVLEQLAYILRKFVRKEDVPARYGGEEFVLLLPRTDIKESKVMAEQLRQQIEDASWVTGRLTVSIGISTFYEDETATGILKKADQALYMSKENGRNRVTHIVDASYTI